MKLLAASKNGMFSCNVDEWMVKINQVIELLEAQKQGSEATEN